MNNMYKHIETMNAVYNHRIFVELNLVILLFCVLFWEAVSIVEEKLVDFFTFQMSGGRFEQATLH